MKLNRDKVPFSKIKNLLPVKEAEFPFHEVPFSEDEIMSSNFDTDSEEGRKLLEQNRTKEFKDLLDKRNLVDDLVYDDAGISARSFLDSMLDKEIHSQNPELKNLKTLPLIAALKKKYYPDLDEASDKVGISTETSAEVGEGDNFSPDDGINIDPTRAGQAGTIMHELGHQLDRTYKSVKNNQEYPFIGGENKEVTELFKKLNKTNPEYAKVLDKEVDLTDSESGEQNNPIPNFSDYNWKEGDFNSNFMTNPSDLQDMIAKKHHIGRNYPFDNLMNLIHKKKVF